MVTKVYGYGIINCKGVPVRYRNGGRVYLDPSGMDVDAVCALMNARCKHPPYRIVELTYEFEEPTKKEQ